MNRRINAALSPRAIRSPWRVLTSRLARANTTHSPISEPAAATATTTGTGSEPPPSDVAAAATTTSPGSTGTMLSTSGAPNTTRTSSHHDTTQSSAIGQARTIGDAPERTGGEPHSSPSLTGPIETTFPLAGPEPGTTPFARNQSPSAAQGRRSGWCRCSGGRSRAQPGWHSSFLDRPPAERPVNRSAQATPHRGTVCDTAPRRRNTRRMNPP